MSEIDPPVPSTTLPIEEMTGSEVTKNKLSLAGFGMAFGLIGLGCYVNSHPVWASGFGLVAAFFLALIFSKPAKIGVCVYCGHRHTGILGDEENKELQCENCLEYLLVHQGAVRALDPTTVSEPPRFVTPAFEDGVWPAGCVACGASPVRYDEIKASSVNALALATGRLRVMKGAAQGVPYCAEHKDALKLSVTQNRKLELQWSSLRMMRRYLALNRSRAGSKGTRW